MNERLAAAWDAGFDTAARCYWHKPRNPFSGEMNDDADFYCSEHGGTSLPEDCNHESHPAFIGPLPRPEPFILPDIKVSRGGIQYAP